MTDDAADHMILLPEFDRGALADRHRPLGNVNCIRSALLYCCLQSQQMPNILTISPKTETSRRLELHTFRDSGSRGGGLAEQTRLGPFLGHPCQAGPAAFAAGNLPQLVRLRSARSRLRCFRESSGAYFEHGKAIRDRHTDEVRDWFG